MVDYKENSSYNNNLFIVGGCFSIDHSKMIKIIWKQNNAI